MPIRQAAHPASGLVSGYEPDVTVTFSSEDARNLLFRSGSRRCCVRCVHPVHPDCAPLGLNVQALKSSAIALEEGTVHMIAAVKSHRIRSLSCSSC